MPPRWSLALLALFVFLGAGLRVWQARESLWLDELHTAWCAGGSLAEVAPRAAIGNQSPLFFWLEWLLVQLFGASELTLRLPSLIAGSLLPAALYGVAWRWTRSSLVALVAAWLATVDPRAIFYATEARPYALVELLAVIHVALFAELLVQPTARLRIALVLGAALLFHLHYTAALLIPAEIAAWLLAIAIDRRAMRYRPAALAVDLFYLAALAAPAAWNVAAIAGRRENWVAFVPQQPAHEMLRLLPWTGAVIFILVDPDSFLRTDTTNKNESRLLLVLAWLLIPVSIAWLTTETDLARIFFVRYLAVSAPAAMLLAALCIRLPPWPAYRIFLALAIGAYAFSSSGIIPQLRHDGRAVADRREDWRSASAWLAQRLADQPYPVLVRAGLIESDGLRVHHDPLLEDYSLLPVTSLYPLPVRRAELLPLPYREAGRLEKWEQDLVRGRGGAWLVVRGSETSAINVERRMIRSVSPTRNGRWHVTERKRFGDLHIVLVVRRSPK
jgi:uncharacterized membrane protein